MNKFKNIVNRRNIFLFIAIVILSRISMLNYSVSIYAKQNNDITINLRKGEIITDIIVSKNKLSLENFKKDDAIIYEGENLKCINDTNLKLSISVIDDLTVNKLSDNKTSLYSINDENIQIEGNSINIYNSKGDILKNSLNTNSIIIFVISLIVISLCVIGITDTIKRMKNDNIKIWNIGIFLLSVFVIYLSSIYLFMLINKMLAILPAILIGLYILLSLKFSIKEWKNIFLSISGVIGVMMIFIITPGNVPDEPSHYIRSYVDSMAITKEAKNSAKLPKCIDLLMEKFTHDVHSLQIKYSGKSYIAELTRDSNYNDTNNFVSSYENTKYLSFLPYLPSAIVNYVTRLLNLPILIGFLLCRLINFIISTILCYYAIKTTPRFKKVFALIATLPIFLQQAAGIDMDFLTNSVAFLFIATILKYYFEEDKLIAKNLVILACEGLALGLCKFGYFPLLLLPIMLPNKKFKNKGTGIIFKISLFIIPIIISYFANFSAVSNPNTNENDMYTVKTVISNPINSAKICIKTFIARFPGDSFTKLIDGFGWSTKYQLEFSLWTVGAIYIILMFTDNEDSIKLNKRIRIIMLAICSIIYLILYGVAFTEWTSINLDKINGLQSRYFIPILPLFYIAISNNFFKANIKDKWKLYSILLFVAHILTCISILNAFY